MIEFYAEGRYMQKDMCAAIAAKPSCLFVEDDITFSFLLSQMLDKVNFAQVSSFAEALSLAYKEDWDFILLDLCLDDYSKNTTIRNISKLAQLADVIVLTNWGDELLARDAILNGAAGYLLKTDIANKNQAQIMRIINDILTVHRASGKLKKVREDMLKTRKDIELLK